MKTLLVTACAVAALTGSAFAQTSGAPKQPGATEPVQNQQAPAAGQRGTDRNQPGQSADTSRQGGIQSVSPGMRLTFYTVQPADMRASKLIGTNIYNLNNENIGDIEDLVIDNGKTIRAVIVSVGGFLGLGDRNVAIEPNALTVSEQNDGSIKVVVNTNKDELKNAPEVKVQDLDKAGTTATTGSTPSSSGNTGTQNTKTKDGQSR